MHSRKPYSQLPRPARVARETRISSATALFAVARRKTHDLAIIRQKPSPKGGVKLQQSFDKVNCYLVLMTAYFDRTTV